MRHDHGEHLVPRRPDGRPVSHPVPSWILVGLAAACLALVLVNVYVSATRHHSMVAAAPASIGLAVVYRAWRVNGRV